ncbi:uncharacterized protein LOC144305792 [Canis aureus]
MQAELPTDPPCRIERKNRIRGRCLPPCPRVLPASSSPRRGSRQSGRRITSGQPTAAGRLSPNAATRRHRHLGIPKGHIAGPKPPPRPPTAPTDRGPESRRASSPSPAPEPEPTWAARCLALALPGGAGVCAPPASRILSALPGRSPRGSPFAFPGAAVEAGPCPAAREASGGRAAPRGTVARRGIRAHTCWRPTLLRNGPRRRLYVRDSETTGQGSRGCRQVCVSRDRKTARAEGSPRGSPSPLCRPHLADQDTGPGHSRGRTARPSAYSGGHEHYYLNHQRVRDLQPERPWLRLHTTTLKGRSWANHSKLVPSEASVVFSSPPRPCYQECYTRKKVHAPVA